MLPGLNSPPSPAPTVEAALADLAGVLTPGGAGTVHDTIGALAACLPAGTGDPLTDLRLLSTRVGASLTVGRSGGQSGYDDLRPDRALACLEGHELLVAALLVAIGRRRHYRVRVARDRRHALVAAASRPTHVLSPRHQSRCLPASAFGEELHLLDGAALTAALFESLIARAWCLGDRAMLRRVERWRAHEHDPVAGPYPGTIATSGLGATR